MKKLKPTLFTVILALSLAVTAFAGDANNPCGEKAMNPCGEKAENPCSHKDGTMFYLDDPMNRNSITFKSEAPLEDIVGTSNKITGYIAFDPMAPKKGGHGEISVPISSLNTGIPLRDEHLRSADWLNADAYPDIHLKSFAVAESNGDEVEMGCPCS